MSKDNKEMNIKLVSLFEQIDDVSDDLDALKNSISTWYFKGYDPVKFGAAKYSVARLTTLMGEISELTNKELNELNAKMSDIKGAEAKLTKKIESVEYQVERARPPSLWDRVCARVKKNEAKILFAVMITAVALAFVKSCFMY